MGHAIHLALHLGVLLFLLNPAPRLLAGPVIGGQIVSPSSNNRRNSNRESQGTLVVTNEATYRRGMPTTTTSIPSASRRGKQLRLDISRMFREDAKDYPDEEIRRLLKQTPDEVKELYNVINTQLDPHMNLTERVAFYNDESSSSSIGENIREESVCRSMTRNIYPREASRANSLVYIPNNQEFMQVIQADICQHPDQECSYLLDSLPYGMTSVCYQKYAYKKLLYMDPLEKRMASDLFRYPSCCACYIRTLPFDLRSANNSTSSPPPIPALHYATDSESMLVTLSPGDNNSASSSNRCHLMNSNENHDTNTRNSKQMQTSKTAATSNHTVVLDDDKVYAPSEDKQHPDKH